MNNAVNFFFLKTTIGYLLFLVGCVPLLKNILLGRRKCATINNADIFLKIHDYKGELVRSLHTKMS